MTPEFQGSLVHLLDDTFFVLSGNESLVITDVSENVERILGIPYKQLLGKDFHVIAHPDDVPLVKNLYQRNAFEITVHLKKANGRYATIFMHGKKRQFHGEDVLVGYWKKVETTSPYLQNMINEKELFEGIVSHSPHVILTVNEKLEIQYINRVAQGFSKLDVIGRSCLDFVLPGHHEKMVSAVEAILGGSDPISLETEGYGDGFSVRWYRSELGPVFKSGKVNGVSMSTVDITDQKNTQLNLTQTRESLNHAQRIAHLGSWTLDLEQGGFQWSKELFRIYEREESKGPAIDTWLEYIHPEDREFVEAHSKKPIKEKHPSSISFRILLPSGTTKHIQAESELVVDAGGYPTKVVGTELDISELKRAQQALLREESKFRAIIENSTDLILTLNEGGISYNSPTVSSVLKYSQKDLSAMSLEDLVHPDDREAFQDLVQSALKQPNKPIAFSKVRLDSKEGFSVFVEGMVAFLPEDPGIEGLVLNCRDISQRVQFEKERDELQKELSQAKKMETIGTLAGGIAHDFKNILMPIIGYTNIVIDDLKSDRVEGAVQDLEKVMAAANRANELVKQILAFSHKMEVERLPTLLSSIISETLQLLRASIPSTVEIIHEIAYKKAIAEVDFAQVQQVIMNLCTNAWHAMQESGGVISVSLSKALDTSHISHLKADQDYALIRIQDTGHGIPKANLERIFDPFYTTKSVGQGTGLGLSVAQGIVTNHGGVITVESQENVGTTFDIYLPTVAKEAFKEVAQQLPDMKGDESILFIDDEEMTREITKRILERSGYVVKSFEDGLAAIEYFEAHPEEFDLVITDQTMPKITGLQLIEKLRNSRMDIPFVLISGSPELLHMNLEEKGVTEFVMKPVNPGTLLQLVQTCLERVS